jgi:hypothetical protein
MTLRLALLGAMLAPAIASAQPTPDPNAPAGEPLPPSVVAQTTQPTPRQIVAQATMGIPPSASTPRPFVILPPSETEDDEVYDAYNAPMFTTGALVFAASYGASVVVAASSDNNRGNNRLYVPVAGPWLALNERGSCDTTRSSCDNETTAKVLLIADGVFQAAGIVGMLDGILQPTSHRVSTRSAKLDTKLRVRPTLVSGGPGVGMFSHF